MGCPPQCRGDLNELDDAADLAVERRSAIRDLAVLPAGTRPAGHGSARGAGSPRGVRRDEHTERRLHAHRRLCEAGEGRIQAERRAPSVQAEGRLDDNRGASRNTDAGPLRLRGRCNEIAIDKPLFTALLPQNSSNHSALYRGVVIDSLLAALLDGGGHWTRFYSPADSERVADRIGRGR